VSLVSDALAGLHGDVESVVVGPAAPHRCPLVCVIREEAVERKTAPPRTRDGWIIPEHRPRLSRIALITLVEDVLGDLELGTVEDDGVGGGGELVGTVVTVVEQGGGSVSVHVEEAGIPELGVPVQQTVVGTGRGQESRSHLGVTGGTKVPVVGGLGPSTVRGDAVDAVVQSVVDGLAKEVFGGSSGIVTEDSKSTKGKTTIANTIPVTRDVGLPPSEVDYGSIKDGLARSQTVEDHVIPHLLLLIVGQDIVKPIVTNGIGGNHLGGIQKVLVVPFVSRRTEVAEAAFYTVVQPLITSKTKVSYLDLIPGSIGPLGVLCHPVGIGQSLDPHLDLSRVVKDTAVTIHVVLDRRSAEIIGGVLENRLVPS
jgi:hypothetical protein